jgi:hypothetical protein
MCLNMIQSGVIRMAPSADDKKYATDTRKWSDGVVADGIYPRWEDSH